MTDYSFEEWKKLAGKISFRNKAFINGKFVEAKSGKTFNSINPATDEVLTSVSECGQEDVDFAVEIARKSFQKGSWSKMPPAERKAILLKLADLIRENLEELSRKNQFEIRNNESNYQQEMLRKVPLTIYTG